MTYIRKQIASWEIKHGQIALTGHNYTATKNVFEHYLGRTFELRTFIGNFPDRHFLNESAKNSMRLASMQFFSKLQEGQVIYLKPIDENKIGVYDTEPIEQPVSTNGQKKVELSTTPNKDEILKHLFDLSKENKDLREENERLLEYKDQIDKYSNLEFIFEDESFMETWLEKNIHKAVSSLRVIERQPTNIWTESFIRDRPDFFCIDQTTKEFVIVENKVRGRNRTVDTQFLKYKAWAKRNIDAINERYKNEGLRATQNFRFVIITDTTDERLQAICEDNKITLVIIEGGISLFPLIPYHLDE